VKRGLRGVRLVISDAHEGLRQAIGTVFSGASWQRCRVHFMRNLLSVVPKAAQETVGAIIRTVFLQADHPSAMAKLRDVCQMLRPKFPDAAEFLESAAEDLLQFAWGCADRRTDEAEDQEDHSVSAIAHVGRGWPRLE
jgi:putative transposase